VLSQPSVARQPRWPTAESEAQSLAENAEWVDGDDASWAVASSQLYSAPRRPGSLHPLPSLVAPDADLVSRMARAQAGIAVAAALGAAILALAGAMSVLWAVILAALSGGGAVAAFVLQRRASLALAGFALLGSQLGMLAWALELAGPRAALLTVVPALTALALRLGGRGAAAVVVAASLALFVALTALQAQDLFWPTLLLTDNQLALLDTSLVIAGTLATLFALLELAAARTRALRVARLWQREGRDLDESYELLRAQVRWDAAHIHQALTAALHGQDVDPIAFKTANETLHTLAETVDTATGRLATLRRDREERVRLHGALRRVTRAADQLALGITPAWPEPSGTALDPLVERLRALRPAPAQPLGTSEQQTSGTQRSPVGSSRSGIATTRERTTGTILPWRPTGTHVAARRPSPADGAASPLMLRRLTPWPSRSGDEPTAQE
jgi:hypothetical protein